MAEGIGRGGYRVLTLVFFGIGVLGLASAAVAWRPAGFFDWLGLALAAAALAALSGVALATLAMPSAQRPALEMRPAGAPSGEPVPLPTPEPPAEVDPGADLGVEYSDFETMPSPEARFTPPPRLQPPPVPVVQPRRTPPPGKGWPERSTQSGVTRRQVAERDWPRDPGPAIEVEGPARPRRDPPITMARTVASAEATGIPEGSTVGKCGNCGVLLVAPKKRPIRLQCPRCERVHTLT